MDSRLLPYGSTNCIRFKGSEYFISADIGSPSSNFDFTLCYFEILVKDVLQENIIILQQKKL
jgi:hypothetical protein